MADKAQALNALGRPLEAQQLLLEDRINRNHTSSLLRLAPVVFYAKVVEAGTLRTRIPKKKAD